MQTSRPTLGCTPGEQSAASGSLGTRMLNFAQHAQHAMSGCTRVLHQVRTLLNTDFM
jgi:hypothetical protein